MKILRRLAVWTLLGVLSLGGASCAFNLVEPSAGGATPFDAANAISLQAQTRSIGETFGPAPR